MNSLKYQLIGVAFEHGTSNFASISNAFPMVLFSEQTALQLLDRLEFENFRNYLSAYPLVRVQFECLKTWGII